VSRVVVVGDSLLDRELAGEVERLCPEAPVPVVDGPVASARAGGAALAAALAARDGHDVALVTALADDDAGRELAALAAAAGVELVDVGLDGSTPEKIRVRAGGRLLLRLDRGSGTCRTPGQAAFEALRGADAVLVSDYGRGLAAERRLRAAIAGAPRVVWDPHPRGPAPVPGAALVTPNAAEAGLPPGLAGPWPAAAARRGRQLLERWRARAVAVTLGERGAVLVARRGAPFAVAAVAAPGADPCGAGDRFAASAAGLLAQGALVHDAVELGVRAASDFVAAGGILCAGAPSPRADRPGDAGDVVARVRAAGGTVVATGGCFDLLHAGHVGLLQAARALGDCLVVLLNSDDSVRRLKGPDRPLVAEADRAQVLGALACVDAVVVFGEDTPETALERLRPHVFAKGGDYELDTLPEAATMARLGGEAVVLPYVPGRSTSALIEKATWHALA
jgi:rfaE bifunctional protein nucleotidyltransferase chain/domain/rfaE bifunctional protein kinase chain/domain